MDLLRKPPLEPLSGGVVGVTIMLIWWSLNGNLVSLVSLEKIPLFGSHWKYRLPATEPSFFPEVQGSATWGSPSLFLFDALSLWSVEKLFRSRLMGLFTLMKFSLIWMILTSQENSLQTWCFKFEKSIRVQGFQKWFLIFTLMVGSLRRSLPMGSSRTTPAQSPGANLVSPI